MLPFPLQAHMLLPLKCPLSELNSLQLMPPLLTNFLTLPLKCEPNSDWPPRTQCHPKIPPAYQWHHLQKAENLQIVFPSHIPFAHHCSNSPSFTHTGNTCTRYRAQVNTEMGAASRLACMCVRPWLWELLGIGRTPESQGCWLTSIRTWASKRGPPFKILSYPRNSRD